MEYLRKLEEQNEKLRQIIERNHYLHKLDCAYEITVSVDRQYNNYSSDLNSFELGWRMTPPDAAEAKEILKKLFKQFIGDEQILFDIRTTSSDNLTSYSTRFKLHEVFYSATLNVKTIESFYKKEGT